MIHTMEIFTHITQEEHTKIFNHQNTKNDKENNCLYNYYLMARGIQIRAFKDYDGETYHYYIRAIINLAKITQIRNTPLPFIVNEENKNRLLSQFEKYIKELLPKRTRLDKWSVTRVDYTFDVKTENVKEYIKLLQRGDKPPHTSIDNESQHKKEIDKTHYKGSCRYKNKSISINFYDKELERKQRNFNYNDLYMSECKNILRLEIQCYKTKTNYLSRTKKLKNNAYGFLISEQEQIKLLLYYIGTICGKAPYYKLKELIQQLENKRINQKDKKEMIQLLKDIAENRSVWKTKRLSKNKKKTKRLLDKMKYHNINPVTIPVNWEENTFTSIYTLIKTLFDTQKN